METRTFNEYAKSTTSTGQNNQISFLLEGFSTANDPTRFPELVASINLAQANGCEYFDSISSYDTEQIGTLLKGKSVNDQKAILLGIFLSFESEGSHTDIIENTLKRPYQEFFGEMPDWLHNLNPFTIKVFAAEVLNEMFDGKPENFKIYNRQIREELTRLSDEISARRFMVYISERPELKTIYGLIGSHHLNMLNKLGDVVTQEGDYLLIKIPMSHRVIDVHLCGGAHGEMAHYELLAKHAGKAGLVIPTPPVIEDKTTEMLIRLLLSSGTFSLKSSSLELSDSDEEEKISIQEDKIEQRSIHELVEQFDYWMNHYVESHKKRGRYDDNNAALIDWLNADGGAKHVKTYTQFCELASELAKIKYATNPPPSELAYNKAMGRQLAKEMPRSSKSEFEGKMFKKKEQQYPQEKPMNELVEQFDYWMKNYNHPQLPDTQHLVGWLYHDSGAKHVKSYAQFCDLAALVHQKGYATNPPPAESEFIKGVEEYSKREKQRGYKF